jgi:hypothetical protein
MDINAGGHGTAATPVTVGVSGGKKGPDLHDDVAKTEIESAVKSAEKATRADLRSHRGQKVDVTV